ncbi:MAG TPA: hypothetical protein VHV32_09745 [Candidatus Angelobacter sp.]|jgi:hypothetical protein|nr:hypothetical protein [Candidatus Angelobacter sp.]
MNDDQTKTAGMTKEEVKTLIKEWAQRLGHVPSLTELLKQRSQPATACGSILAPMLERSKSAVGGMGRDGPQARKDTYGV